MIKQEQQPARSEVEEVAPQVLRMQLPIEIPGLRHVNMYCLRDARGATLIDPGLPDEASWAVLQERLRQVELELRHIHTVLITHSHPDHFGGAARLHEASGARVIVHEAFSVFGERPERAHLEVSVEHLAPQPVVQRELGGIPEIAPLPWGGEIAERTDRARKQWERIRSSGPRAVFPPITHVVRDGDVVELADRAFSVVYSPGHTGDHICFLDREVGTLIAGDHVLPSITPHISGMNKLEDPLQAFFDSLDRVAELRGISRCLPAHGDPFDDLEGRVQAIKQHHRERLDKLVNIARGFGKPASVRDYSHHLFAERNWGFMAESETYAHLEHLRRLGRAAAHRANDGLLMFEA